MTERRMIIPPGMENIVERFRYAPGVLVGDTLYISGQVGRDEKLQVIADTEAQFDQCFRNVKKVLDAAGFTFADVVELETWFLRFPADLPLFLQVKDRWITGPVFPTWTGFGVASFSMPGIVCEVKVTAVRP
ncbi:MAG TPA: RidA family protein [Falsiroseomonas sp.]|jgi:enamine deaminase RidA (YjgF/YER057c/UK114 family)|nr:RidA family protein [Falsiroseomonas sp.]